MDAKLQAIKERRGGKGRQATTSERKAFAAGAIVNKGPAASAAAGDDNYSCASTLPSSLARHPIAFSATATLDQRSVRHGTVDTAAQLHVCGQKGARGKGARILLKGITGDTVDAERADVVFPVTTTEGKRYAIFMQNQALVVNKETETLLSVAVLLKAGFDVKFVTGNKKDPTFGGYLVTPDGQRLATIYGTCPCGVTLRATQVTKWPPPQARPQHSCRLQPLSKPWRSPLFLTLRQCSWYMTFGAIRATTSWSKSTRQGGGKDSQKASSLSCANSTVLLALYLNARAGIAALSA